LWRPFETRPLTYLTFWLNEQIDGHNPVGYHALNLGLHLIAVWLLWDVLRRMMPERAAWIGAAIFAVHPFQAEPVNYIFARSTTLATVLCLASLASWIRGKRWWAVAWFGCALLAKEECVAFPALLLLLEWWQTRARRGATTLDLKFALRPIIVMFALAVMAGVRVLIASAQIEGSGAGTQAGISWRAYGLTQGLVILRYLRMLILPWGFSIDPAVAIPPLWLGALAWIAVGCLAGSLAYFAMRGRPAALWFLAGLLLLLPSSSILPAADLAADRRLYLPMIAIAAGIGLMLQSARLSIVAAILVFFTGFSIARTATWRSDASIWEDAAAKAPSKVRPKLQLARALDPQRALKVLEVAQRIAPDDPSIPAEQGRVYLSSGRPDLALLAFGRALALAPRSSVALNNRGAALLALNQRDAAQADFERALAIDACQFDARLNLQRLGVSAPPPSRCKFSTEQARALLGR